jgi:hypothetical protein
VALEDWAQGALNDSREDCDFEAAQHQEVDKAGGDERLLELCRDSLSDAEDHAEQHGGVRRG